MHILPLIYTTLVLTLLLSSSLVRSKCPDLFYGDENNDDDYESDDQFFVEHHNETTNSTNETVQCPQLICSHNAKKIINNYLEWQQNYVKPNPMASPCLRCTLCLVVAREIDELFSESLKKFDKTNFVEGIEKLTNDLKNLCKKGFEGYAMRKKNDELHSLSTDSACNEYVQTAFDGQWNKKLRETCLAYAPYMDMQYLFQEYLRKTKTEEHDLSDYLCRNGGIFRDCSGVDYKSAQQEEQEDTGLFGLSNFIFSGT